MYYNLRPAVPGGGIETLLIRNIVPTHFARRLLNPVVMYFICHWLERFLLQAPCR